MNRQLPDSFTSLMRFDADRLSSGVKERVLTSKGGPIQFLFVAAITRSDPSMKMTAFTSNTVPNSEMTSCDMSMPFRCPASSSTY